MLALMCALSYWGQAKVDDIAMRRAAALAIPAKFIQGCLGDMMEARRRWDITRKWREEFEVDQVHDMDTRVRWRRSGTGLSGLRCGDVCWALGS